MLVTLYFTFAAKFAVMTGLSAVALMAIGLAVTGLAPEVEVIPLPNVQLTK